MCGIAGYIDMKKGIDTSLLVSMTNAARHRGPDDEGYVLINGETIAHYSGDGTHPVLKEKMRPINSADTGGTVIGLGHRRLSIIDVSAAGHQPLEKKEKVIIYNGMIYNYIELQDELRSYGYYFTGSSDTEVILAAYDYWGGDCVSRFNGMWAFAIYDKKERTLFLSRDRYGVKPLYYYIADNKIIFSSEIKQILMDNEVPRRMNTEIMANDLLYGYREYCEQTFFQNIFQLRGGYNAIIALDFENKKITDFNIKQYYLIDCISEKQSGESGISILKNELTRAVNWRLRSDVKLGSCLSGGLDSSSIVAIACRLLKQQGCEPEEFETVTSVFPDSPEVDEAEYSRAVAKHCGCKENQVFTDAGNVQEDLEKICRHYDEPPPGFIEHQWRVFEKASALGCKVMLDGQGGDETLCGYNPYYGIYLYNMLKEKGPFRYIRELTVCVKNSGMSVSVAVRNTLAFIKTLKLTKLYLSNKRYLNKSILHSKNVKAIEHLLTPESGTGLQKLDLTAINLPYILHNVDRCSMAHALEVRLPFMDYQFVETAVPIPLTEKVKNGYTKYPLREIIKDMLPEEAVWRRHKLGFAMPEKKWLYEIDRSYILKLLDNARSSAIFNVNRLKKEYLKEKADVRMFTQFIMVETWMRVFDVAGA